MAGPLCTRILADLGAEVVKVERAPNGDFARHWDQKVDGESAYFWWLNGGKQSVSADLRLEEGRAALERLLSGADVLVYNMTPAAADRLGLTSPELRKRFPALIVCQISGYGNESTQFRSRKAYDMLIQAESGVMSLTGNLEQPSRVGVSLCDVATGLYAAILVLAALRERERSGLGTWLDVAMLDATIEFLGPMLTTYLNSGVVYPRSADQHPAIAPYGAFQCADGQSIVLAVEQDDEWHLFCNSFLEDKHMAVDARFATNERRVANRAMLDEMVSFRFARLTFDEAAKTLDALGLAYASLNDIAGLAKHPVVRARSIVREVTSSSGKIVQTLVGLGARSFPSSFERRQRPPDLNEDAIRLLTPLDETQPVEDC